MFEIHRVNDNEIKLVGHFDASQQATASDVFDTVNASTTVRFDDLDYISSAGLSVLLYTQQRLSKVEGVLKLTGMNPHVRLVFEYAGFEQIFEIE